MYSMEDYRMALEERDSYDMDSKAWKLAQMKVQGIVSAMVAARNEDMIREVVDEVYSLNDCGMEFEDEVIQHDIWLLESNGYIEEAEELKGLDWA